MARKRRSSSSRAKQREIASLSIEQWNALWDRPGDVEDEESIPNGATSADDEITKKPREKKQLTRRRKEN